MIGRIVKHPRYGLGEIVFIQRKIINPDTKAFIVEGVTIRLLTSSGVRLLNHDRTFPRLVKDPKPLSKYYEHNLKNLVLVDNEKS